MTHDNSFSIDRFLSLSGTELRNYAEAFVNAESHGIPESVYEPLQSKLPDLDAEHTVYALEICMLLKPAEFVSRAAQFLAHSDASVCCAAFRVIEGLPASFLTEDLVKEISATPTTDLFTTHVRTGDRIRIGTNEEFIRGLLTKHLQAMD